MRALFRFLSLLLCVELIVAPINSELSLLSRKAYAESCSAGFTYDSVLNRCLTTAETANVMNATANCAQGDIQCYKTNAQSAFQEKVNKGEAPERKENNQFVSTVANVAAVAGPVTIFALGLHTGKSTCQAPSFWSMVAGSAALVIGDNLADLLHKNRLKKIREEWGKIVNPEEAQGDQDKVREANSEAQSRAFEMLAKSEDSMVKAAKMKKNLFLVASIAYAASAVFAFAETNMIAGSAAFICPQTASFFRQEKERIFSYYSNGGTNLNLINTQSLYNLKNSSDLASFIMNQQEAQGGVVHLEDFSDLTLSLKPLEKDKSVLSAFKEISLQILSNVSPINNSYAQTTAVGTNAAKSFKEDDGKSNAVLNMGLGLAAGVAAKVLAAKLTLKAEVTHPGPRAIFAGSMSAMTLVMANHAGSQAEASKKRADLLRKMQDSFISASGALNACKSEDRSDPSKPTCYCYTPDNQRNSNRTSSQVCQKLWTGLNTGSELASLGTPDDTKICISNKGQADSSCSCKANNTCMKVGTGNLPGLSTGTMSVLNSALAPLNKIADGTASAATLDGANLSNQAMKMQNMVKALDKNKSQKDLKDKEKKEAALMANLNKASASLGADNMLGSTGSSGLPSNVGEAASMLEKELKEAGAEVTSHASETVNAPTNAQGVDGLEFGLTADQAAAQETQIAEVMKENLDYGTNDINQGSKTNIFEVLSNRYQRSGMRRLFDEKGTTQADKAGQTDINQ